MDLSRRDLLASSAAIAGTAAAASAAISQDEAEARATGKPGKTPHTKEVGMACGVFRSVSVSMPGRRATLDGWRTWSVAHAR